MDFTKLTVVDLTALRHAIAAELKNREAAAIEKARTDISAIAASVGIPVAILMGKASTKETGVKNKAAVKYRDPSNPNNQWTGRGRSPAWVKALETAGTLDSAKV
ncbi:H-NS family nucleoid-associated regulatory protein [Massilia sp. CCM 8734]|uniref:H-NS histone family protein n=1 Tax=Massilia sp. CCM 8734 TaxID=2609283 RepID=UPI001423ACE2|nr:H-NS histone family protein [Massilia sp. CCM 8734]NIA00576.1 H-NS histone family protein [Massilia sp. CCM 8734]